jgi:hypothetical protein
MCESDDVKIKAELELPGTLKEKKRGNDRDPNRLV